MKKLITITLIMAATASFAGFYKQGTNLVDAVEYATKFGNSRTNCNIYVVNFKEMTENEYSICDDLISKNGNYTMSFGATNFTKTLNNLKPVAKEKYPDCYNLVCQYIDGLKPVNGDTRMERESIYLYFDLRNGRYIKSNKIKLISEQSSKFAKAKIRKDGQTFVGEAGTAKVKAYVDAVTDAFNAPKYKGLDKALKDIDMDFGMNMTFVPKYTDEEITKMKNDIMFGNIDFNTLYQNILKAYLGVEEYNKFVKEYNGDK